MALSKPKDNDAMRELTSAKTVKEDVALLMAPYINFEHFLVPAPLSICVLGRLMLVATQADFDLSKKPPKGGFQLLRHPESFRACLVQVANDGYRAFNKAHTNMDKIRLQSMQTPDSLKSTLQVLFKGSPDEIQDFLPIELNTMKNSAEDCLKYAKETEAAFDQIMLVTAELLEACVSAEGQYNQQLRETEIKLKVAEMQKQKLEIEEELNRENKKKLEEAMDKAEEEYYKALNDIPGAWGLIGIQATENISNTVSGALNCLTLGVGTKLLAGERAAVKGLSMFTQNLKGFSNLAGKVTGIFKKGDAKEGQAEGQGQGQDEEFTHVMDQALMTSCTRAIKVQSLAQYLYNTFVKKDDVTLNLIHVTMETKRQLQQCVEELKAARTEVEQFNNDIAGKVHALCGWWIEICSDLQGVLESITVDEQTGKDIAERMTDCHSRAVTTASQAESIMGNAHFDIKPPILVKQQTSAGDNEERSMKDLATENAKMKLTMSSETFKQSQEMYDKACDRLKETNQELRQFMAETAELDMKKVDFEKIRETLKRGIVAFAELRDQWSKMVQFFQMTTNIIDVCLNKTVKKLTEQVEVAGERSLAGYSIDGLRKDMIYQQAFQAAKISHVVNMVSTSYVQVSQGHVMSRIAGLSRLLSFNPETDHDQIQRAMFSLTHDFEEAQDEIVDLVQKNKRDFDQRVDLKLKALSRALPPSSPGTERLQAAVKQGVAQAKVTLASRPAEALSDDAIDDLVG